jgi:Ca2+-binding EF-hand superfamily protein
MAKLSEETMDEINERFDVFDKAGDKCIDADQICDVLRSLGMNPITGDVNKMIKSSNLGGKRVDIPTFCSMYEQLENAPLIATIEDMVECLKTFDKDNKGSMSGAALRAMLVNLGDKLSVQQADYIMSQYEDQHGLVIYEQMIKTLAAS